MSSSSTPLKVNYLVIRTLHFRGVRGDLQERPLSVFPMPILGFPMPLSQSSEHKKPDFVLEMPENGGFGGQKRTKIPILCSNAPKRGFRRQKAHKNGNFVLEKPEIEGSEGLGAHGLCRRVANSAGNGCRLAGGRCSDTEQKTEEGDRKVPPSSVCSVRSLSLNLQVPPLWSCTTGTALA